MSASQITAVSGMAMVLRGNDIDTDRIIPARFLKTVTFDGLERHLFTDDRAEALRAGRTHVFDDPQSQGARILVVNKNFGCGSSREHAPQALYRWGIRAVIGESFSEIFFSNSLMLGLPCVSLAELDLLTLMHALALAPATPVVADIAAARVTCGDAMWPALIPQHARDALTSGHWDGAGLLLENYDEVAAAEGRLPY